jgi:hypothetical protein
MDSAPTVIGRSSGAPQPLAITAVTVNGAPAECLYVTRWVRVSSKRSIVDLFTELRCTESLEDALSYGIRLACELTDCAAAALSRDSGPDFHTGCWTIYDPGSLISMWTVERRKGFSSADAGEHGAQIADVSTSENPLTMARVPLRCEGRTAALLLLWSTGAINTTSIECRLQPLDTVLGALVVAMNGASGLNGVLDPQAFRARISSEISRAQRAGEGFSLVHVWLSTELPDCGESSSWSASVRIGKTIQSWLRKSDVVGLMAPRRFGVLLADCGPLGALIAQRRIRQLLTASSPDTPQPICTDPQLQTVSFPGDASDVDTLCAAGDWPISEGSQTSPLLGAAP